MNLSRLPSPSVKALRQRLDDKREAMDMQTQWKPYYRMGAVDYRLASEEVRRLKQRHKDWFGIN